MARILIVDDDDIFRAMLKQLLEREGYDVIDTDDGHVAHDLYQAHPTDAVIVDMVMSAKTGIATIMDLRDAFPGVRIIAMSGDPHVFPEDYLEVAKGLGAMCAITKPFKSAEFLKAVSGIVSP